MKQLWLRLLPWLLVLAAAVGLSVAWGCPMRQLLGQGCPFCGFSRAMLAALRLDFPGAFRYHPLWPVFPAALGLSLWLEHRKPGSAKPLGLAVLILALAVYALRLYLRDPVVFPQSST